MIIVKIIIKIIARMTIKALNLLKSFQHNELEQLQNTQCMIKAKPLITYIR